MASHENIQVSLLEENQWSAEAESMLTKMKQTSGQIISLENGAEAYFLKPHGLDPNKRHPMLVMLHGGPFSSMPYHHFTIIRSLMLLKGYNLLLVSYRGSIGYGLD